MVMRLHVGSISDYIVKVENLKVYFTKGGIFSKKYIVKALDNVTLSIKENYVR
jgi:ABC-type oligopeptide transport system, ATPase component